MRDGGWSDDRSQFGRIRLIEQSAATALSALAGKALSGADAVLFDRRLAPLIAGLLPAGGYAEPLTEAAEEEALTRALKLASEGWSVVQLVEPRRGWCRRLNAATAALNGTTGTGELALRLIGEIPADPPAIPDAHPLDPSGRVVDIAEDEPLTLILGPLAGGASAAAYAFAAGNGLAG
jgi:hypothetical protein